VLPITLLAGNCHAPTAKPNGCFGPFRAFSSEVDTGSREGNASKQQSRASVLIQSEPIML
jgi:hypothetical protein